MDFHYIIRQATAEDCKDIVELTKELVRFEGEDPDEIVENTEKGKLTSRLKS